MLEIGIPVYKARDTLRKGLDSLVAQTKENFIVCLSIDADGEDYSDIIEEYRRRGLKIRVINAKENGGPGMARQRILDTTQCDYIMFMDADDMLLPRAVQLLYQPAKEQNLDIVRSSFIREQQNGDQYITKDVNTITWFHGKIYRVGYLKEKDIHFLPGLRTDEDAYFNFVAWNSTKSRGELNEMTYIWRDNPNSITRCNNRKEYFAKTYNYYIRSQVEGLKKLYKLNKEGINFLLVGQTLINIYYYYMNAKFDQLPLEETDKMISSLSNEEWVTPFLSDPQNWCDIVQTVKAGAIHEGEGVVFYNETFFSWVMRLLKK